MGYGTKKATHQMKKGVPRPAPANEFCFAPKRLAERIRFADSLNAPAAAAPMLTLVAGLAVSAATGEGVFTITPTVRVSVPQNSFAGSYASTLTLSVVSGP